MWRPLGFERGRDNLPACVGTESGAPHLPSLLAHAKRYNEGRRIVDELKVIPSIVVEGPRHLTQIKGTLLFHALRPHGGVKMGVRWCSKKYVAVFVWR